MLTSTRSTDSVGTISGKGAVFIEARVTKEAHHKGRIYVRSFTQLTFYTESLGGLRNKRSTYTYLQRVGTALHPSTAWHGLVAGMYRRRGLHRIISPKDTSPKEQ